MDKAQTTAIAPAAGRGAVTRINHARGATRRDGAVDRARTARRDLRPRSERFAHLKRRYD